MKINSTKVKIYFALFILLNSLLSTAQPARNKTFFTGYFGGSGGTIESNFYNNAFVERTDTGLLFSEKIYSTYDFFATQNSTYCDDNGKPILQWQGCYLLDAKTFQPIVNSDFSNDPGTEPYHNYQFCREYSPGPGLPEVTVNYFLNWSTFFLDRGNPRNILLVYYRIFDPPSGDSIYIYTAGIDLLADEGPTVYYKDSMLIKNLNLMSGSISAIRHANGIDWFIVFTEDQSKNWYSVLFDKDGLHPAVVSTIDQWEVGADEGLSSISPDGTKYVLSSFRGGFIVMDFDRCTGKFTYLNQHAIPTTEHTDFYRFAEFSPQGRFLYINDINRIHQYDMDDPNFVESRITVAKFDTSQNSGFPFKGYISMPVKGYDNKIYYWSGNTISLIHRIEFPDQKGPDVGWKQDFYRTPIAIPWFLSTFVDYGMGPLEGSPCMSSTNSGQSYDFITCYPNPAQDIISAAIDRKYDHAIVIIIDNKGQRVYKGDVPNLRSGINISKWIPGPYIVHIDGRPAGRFVKI